MPAAIQVTQTGETDASGNPVTQTKETDASGNPVDADDITTIQ